MQASTATFLSARRSNHECLLLAILNMSTGISQESFKNILTLIDEKAEELSATFLRSAAIEIEN